MSLQLEEKTRQVLEVLKAQAEARNMGLAEYLQLFAEAGQVGTPEGQPSLAEFESLLGQLSQGLCVFPALPSDFSRADIYTGHD